MKEKIIGILMHQNSNVGMIGDGVNDVLALKKARVSVAMNNGAQIAKEVSDIILLDNAFSTLPTAIEEGRDITARIYAIAKIFFVKVTYFMVLFFLVGFANLPFPISLRQTTLLGFIITFIPIMLITFKILRPAAQHRASKEVTEYTLIAGSIGGLAMTYLTVVIITFFGQSIELSRTLITIFAALYSTVIFLSIMGISIFKLSSIKQNIFATILIISLGLLAILLPFRFAPHLFNLVSLKAYHWLILAVLVSFCALLLSILEDKTHLNSIKKWLN